MIHIANAEFVMFSTRDWPVESFTSEMEVCPTEYYKVGDKMNNCNRCKIETAWKLNKRLDCDIETPSDVLLAIVDILSPKLEIIKHYKEVHDLTCVLYLHAIFDDVIVPNVQLECAVIRFAHELDAKFDIYLNASPGVAC